MVVSVKILSGKSVLVLVLAGLSAGARADIVTQIPAGGSLILSQTWTATAQGTQSPTTITGDGSTTDGLGPVHVSDLTTNPASNYNLVDTIAGAAAGNYAVGTIQGQPYNFVDTYVVDVPNAVTSAYVFSLNLSAQLGIQNLTARLYDYSVNGVTNLTIGGAGPVAGIVDSWSADMNGVVSSTQLFSSSVPAGEFVLQIAGLETGTQSGSYDGSLAVTPVPLPPALPLTVAGLGALGILGRRRRLV